MTELTFEALGVAQPLLKALAALNITVPTPVQARSIPPLLEGRDILALAQTGTGKTAAFALPLLQRLAAEQKPLLPRSAQVLVLAPTRELAVQIGESFRAYGAGQRFFMTTVFGGVGYGNQIKALEKGVHVLVATPGRLLDLIEGRHVDLSKVSALVLDEADRMLDMGFVRDVTRIVKLVPKDRQSLLFSATMPTSVEGLAANILRSPVRVEVTPEVVTVDKIAQSVHFVGQQQKRGLLVDLLADPAMSRVIVFTRTKHGANRVSEHLEDARISSSAIHGNKSQGARQKALGEFKTGRCRVLVATDIAARGIDVREVTHVINFELPHEPESYVHRIGRTARAGHDGIAISFCSPDEAPLLRQIERLIRKPVPVASGSARPDGREKTQRIESRRDTPPARDGRQDQRARDDRHEPRRDERRPVQAGQPLKTDARPDSGRRRRFRGPRRSAA